MPRRTWRTTKTSSRRTPLFSTVRATSQNIVDPQKRRLGIAVVAAGDGEVFYVEEFSD